MVGDWFEDALRLDIASPDYPTWAEVEADAAVQILHGNLFSGKGRRETPKGHNLVIDYYFEVT